MRQINMQEAHDIVLGIAKELHRVCVKNHIPYYMGYGTMLGAIRHKGFIPWDDDMDFCVRREYIEQLVEACNKDLQKPYSLVTCYNSYYPIGYLKIQDERTLAMEHVLDYRDNAYIGLNIDIFPLENCCTDIKSLAPFIRKNILIRAIINCKFLKLKKHWYRRLANIILHKFSDQSSKNIITWVNKQETLSKAISQTGEGNLVNMFGIYKLKDIYPEAMFGAPILYEFENTKLYGVSQPEKYLEQLYGDYMQIPPVEKRHYHLENCFIK